MRIGIDLDGVVFDTESYFRTYSELFDIELGGKGAINPEELKIQKRYQWTDQQVKNFFEKYLTQIMFDAPVLPCVKQVLDKLKNDGHTLIAVTNRGSISASEIQITEQRLKQENITFDAMFFNPKSKTDICMEQHIDVMIDDLYENVIDLVKHEIRCLYFVNLPQKAINHPKVCEVRNWGEIYRVVMDMAKNH